MDPYAPIAGISLERYAELSADITGVTDKNEIARIVEANGVTRADWETAVAGWMARMQDMALMGQVATAYMPLYQAALARKRAASGQDVPSVTFEDYVGMCGTSAAIGYEGMLAFYKIDGATWTLIAGDWNAKIPTNPQYMSYGVLVQQEQARVRAGGAPRPVNVGAAAGPHAAAPQGLDPRASQGGLPAAPAPAQAAPAPAQAAPAYAAPAPAPAQAAPAPAQAAPAPAYAAPAPAPAQAAPAPAYAAPAPAPAAAGPAPVYTPAPAPAAPQAAGQWQGHQGQQFMQQAGQAANAVAGAAVAGFNLLGSAINNAVMGPGSRVLVTWSDGNRYPATVAQMANGQVLVTMSDGRQLWVPQHLVTAA